MRKPGLLAVLPAPWPLAFPTPRYGRITSTRITEGTPMLINCVAYENGAKLADIPVADISNYCTPAWATEQDPV